MNGNNHTDISPQRNNTGGDGGGGGGGTASNGSGIEGLYPPQDNDVHSKNTNTSTSNLDVEGGYAISRSDGAAKEHTGLVPIQAPATSALPRAVGGELLGSGGSGQIGGDGPSGLSEKPATTRGQPLDDAAKLAAGSPEPQGTMPNFGNPLDLHPPEDLLYDIEFSREPDHEGAQVARLKAEVRGCLIIFS